MPGTMSIPRTGPKLSAGVLTADLTRLGDELAILRGTGCWAHVDVMDGSFCPQLTVGPGFVAAVAAAGIPVDAHLLVDEPRRLLPDIVAAGPAVVTVHAEATRHPHRTLQELTALAAARPAPVLRGVAISPGTPVTAVEPLLELTDLVLVLAVDPGWPGQPPAANTRRRVAAVRHLAADRPAGHGRRRRRRDHGQRRRDRGLGSRRRGQRQRHLRRPRPGRQPGPHARPAQHDPGKEYR